MGRGLNVFACVAAAVCLSVVTHLFIPAPAPQELLQTETLWGGWLSGLDDRVPNNGQAVDVGGRVVRETAPSGALPGFGGGQQFLSDVVQHDPHFEGGMYWGQPPKHPAARPHPRRTSRHALPNRQFHGIMHELRSQMPPAAPRWAVARQGQQLMHQAVRQPVYRNGGMVQQQHTAFASGPKGPAMPQHRFVRHARPLKKVQAAQQPAVQVKVPGQIPAQAQVPQEVVKPAMDTPTSATVAAAYKRAKQLQEKDAVKRGDNARDAARKLKKPQHHDQAAALENTASSLRELAEAMQSKRFKASPARLAAIAKNLAVVSDSLSGDAERGATQ